MPFSVLMSIYSKSRPDDLSACLESIAMQSLQPAEVVIIYDGPVATETDACVNDYASRLPIKTIIFSENRGLGAALRDGIEHCENEIIARMDTDCVCCPGRFEKQHALITSHNDVSVIGGIIREHLEDQTERQVVERQLPESSSAIARWARYRNPLNHPTVMYRKQAVLEAGNYVPIDLFEDYYLWARMLTAGFKFLNLPVVLVETTVDDAFFRRRAGWSYLCVELRLAQLLRRAGFHNLWDTLRFVVTRAPTRLMPRSALAWLYRYSLRKQSTAIVRP